MSIASLFQSFTGKGDAAQATQVTQAAPAATTQVDANGQVIDPNAPAPQPLDDAASWFTPKDTDVKPTEFDASKLIDQSPEAQAELSKAVGNLNFMQGIVTPEVLAKMEAGGPDAVQTTLALFNKGLQSAFQAATQAAIKINETSIAKASPQIDSKVAAILKARDTTAAIKDASPALQHPAAQFMVDTMAEKFSAKYPTATKDEITAMAKKFVTDFATVATPQETKPAVPAGQTDWTTFMAE